MMTRLSRSAPASTNEPVDAVLISQKDLDALKRIRELAVRWAEKRQMLADWTEETVSMSVSNLNGTVTASFQSFAALEESARQCEVDFLGSISVPQKSLHDAISVDAAMRSN